MIHLNTLPSEVLAHIMELGTASPEIDFGQENLPALVSLVRNPIFSPVDQPYHGLQRITSIYKNSNVHCPFQRDIPKTPIWISPRAQPNLVEAAMAVILPELARWRHLIIVVPDFEVTYSAVSRVGDAFKTNKSLAPNLEFLRLYGPPELDPMQPEPRDLLPPISLFGPVKADPDDEDEFDPTPRLRDVVLCGIPPTSTQFARLTTGSPKPHPLILNANGSTIPPLDIPSP
ncbi:LOW QUALITY PROTEIN: hypothetical protein RSAG8_12707, partial [Rhizoctonia solani AG-8 WAC10335]